MVCVMHSILRIDKGFGKLNELLTINHLSVSFEMEQGVLQAVRDISFSVGYGETVAIVGESGAGKSQVFHAMMGLQSRNACLDGSVKFVGQELINTSDKELNELRGKEISIIFQDPMTALNPYLKIGRQLTEVLQVHKKISYRKAKEQVIVALSEVMIPKSEIRFNQYPHELSGGMRQRVLIAMALLCKPKLIIADEPTTALDVMVQTKVISLLRKIHEQYQVSIVLITHDLPLVAGLCDRIIIMYAGQIVEMGSVLEIYEQARHPYTQALLKANPSNNNEHRLTTIPGQLPDPINPIKGCAFAPRCQKADKQCEVVKPEMIKVTDTQSVSCLNWEKT